jgi:hypothetical protein
MVLFICTYFVISNMIKNLLINSKDSVYLKKIFEQLVKFFECTKNVCTLKLLQTCLCSISGKCYTLKLAYFKIRKKYLNCFC